MVQINDIIYLVFEGGGGKGNAYVGAIQALEEIGLLPLHKHEEGEEIQITGVAGASAGAITALMVALGLTSDDIQFESDKSNNRNQLFNGKGFEFFDFFKEDIPLPGAYRGIHIDKSGNSSIGYSHDCVHVDDDFDKNVNNIKKTLISEFDFTKELLEDVERRSFKELKKRKIEVGAGFNLQPTPKPDRFVTTLYSLEYTLFMKVVGPFIEKKLVNILKDEPENVIVNQIYGSFNDYMYNILYDRGMFTGTMTRKYFKSLIERYLTKYHKDNYETAGSVSGNVLTFELFHQITGVDIRISGTNMTEGENLIFSKDSTPKFPVAEAVSISMNIPGVFKPIYIKNDKENTDPISGLWVDGGVLNNLPFQAFEGELGFNERQVLGFNIIEGPDPIVFKEYGNNPWFINDEKYKQFVRNYIIKTQSIPPRKMPVKKGVISPVTPSALLGNTLFSVFGYLLNTWLDDATTSQLTEEQREASVVDIYSYHIGTLDFTPDTSLLEFVIEQAKKRTIEKVGL